MDEALWLATWALLGVAVLLGLLCVLLYGLSMLNK